MRRSAAALCFSTLLAVPAQAVESIEHRVESGESLWSIAAQEDTLVQPVLTQCGDGLGKRMGPL